MVYSGSWIKSLKLLRVRCVKVQDFLFGWWENLSKLIERLNLESWIFVFFFLKKEGKTHLCFYKIFSYMHWVWLFLVNFIAGCLHKALSPKLCVLSLAKHPTNVQSWWRHVSKWELEECRCPSCFGWNRRFGFLKDLG